MDTPLVAFRPPEPAASLRGGPRRRAPAGPAPIVVIPTVETPGAAHRMADRGRRAIGTSLGRSLVGLGLLLVVSTVGTVAAPALWDRPVLLVLLSPGCRS